MRACSLLMAGLAAAFVGCRTPTVPVEVDVKPIHITIDVNLRIERELDDFFDDIDDADPTAE